MVTSASGSVFPFRTEFPICKKTQNTSIDFYIFRYGGTT